MLPKSKKLIKICKEYSLLTAKTAFNACEKISQDVFETIYGISNCDTKALLYGLDIKREKPFVRCPVFLKDVEDKNIYTCGLCFALLTIYKGIEKSEELLLDDYKDMISCLINTIVLVAIQKDDENNEPVVFWPTKIAPTQVVESGTFNQTTIALSTFLRVGFLDDTKEENRNLSREVMLNRYKLVANALSWLSAKQIKDGVEEAGAWSYGEACKTNEGKNITFAVLSSHFCYETIEKYVSFFSDYSGHESPRFGRNEMVVAANPPILDRMYRACYLFEKWVEKTMSITGAVKKTNMPEENESFLHTCLCHIVYFFHSPNSKTMSLNVPTLQKSVKYVVKNMDHLTFKEHEVIEMYRYDCFANRGQTDKSEKSPIPMSEPDTYEIIPEFLFINFSSRLLKCAYACHLSNSQKNRLKEGNYIAYEKLLAKVDKTVKLRDSEDNLCLRGQRDYSIYGLYDLQVCMLEYLETTRNGKTTIISSPLKIRIRKLLAQILPTMLGIGSIVVAWFSQTKYPAVSNVAIAVGAFFLGLCPLVKAVKKFFERED